MPRAVRSKRKEEKVPIWNQTFFRVCAILSALFLALQALLPLWRVVPFVQGSASIPLRYNVHFGVHTLGAWWRIFTPFGIGLLFILLNIFFAYRISQKEPMIARGLMALTVLIEFLLFLGVVALVLVNIAYA